MNDTWTLLTELAILEEHTTILFLYYIVCDVLLLFEAFVIAYCKRFYILFRKIVSSLLVFYSIKHAMFEIHTAHSFRYYF